MALLEILKFPDPRLRTVAKPVQEVNDAIRTLVDNMFETMYSTNGIGLAATQVNHHIRVIVIDISRDQTEPLVLINPEIKTHEGIQTYEEGCLSVPGFSEDIERFSAIIVTAIDRNGDSFELSCDQLLSVCIQHEIDHLNGKLFVDYISNLKRQRIKKILEKERKERVKAAKEDKKEL